MQPLLPCGEGVLLRLLISAPESFGIRNEALEVALVTTTGFASSVSLAPSLPVLSRFVVKTTVGPIHAVHCFEKSLARVVGRHQPSAHRLKDVKDGQQFYVEPPPLANGPLPKLGK